jgi:hypothetical protein
MNAPGLHNIDVKILTAGAPSGFLLHLNKRFHGQARKAPPWPVES